MAAMDRRQSDVLVDEVVVQRRVGGRRSPRPAGRSGNPRPCGCFAVPAVSVSSVMIASVGELRPALWQGRAVRVAVVAGPDPGHSFPAIALCQRFAEAGDEPTLFTGVEWLEAARAAGVDTVELDGLVGHRRRSRRRGQDPPAGRADGRAQRAGAARPGARPGGLRRHHRRRWHGRRAAGDPVDRAQPASAVPAVEGAAADRQRPGAGHRRRAAGCAMPRCGR